MKISSVAWFLLASAIMPAQLIRFDSSPLGPLTGEWTVGMTHKGGPPKWEVLPDASAPSNPNVLAQQCPPTTRRLLSFCDLQRSECQRRFRQRPVQNDLWKCRSGGWACLAIPRCRQLLHRSGHALEDNVVLYKVEKGERISRLPGTCRPGLTGVKHTIPKQKWNTLKVEFKGAVFAVFFDGAKGHGTRGLDLFTGQDRPLDQGR